MEQIMYSLPTPEFVDLLRQVVSEELAKTPHGSVEPSRPEILGLQECAVLTGFARSTIYALVSRGEIPFAKKNGRLFFFRSSIEQWIKEEVREPRSPLDAAERHLLSTRKRKGGVK